MSLRGAKRRGNLIGFEIATPRSEARNDKSTHCVFLLEYKDSYLILWAGITEAREQLEKRNYGLAEELLKQAQRKAEESYIIHPENLSPEA